MSLRHLLILPLLALLLGGCAARLSAEKYSQIVIGMTHAQVLELLGTPDDCSAAFSVSRCVWSQGGSSINVIFVNDQVTLYNAQGLR